MNQNSSKQENGTVASHVVETKPISEWKVQLSFTPEPWAVETPRDRYDAESDDEWDEWDESYPHGVTVRAKWNTPRAGQLGYEICRMSGVHEHTLANASLIAAAPALYALALRILNEGQTMPVEEIADQAYNAILLAHGQDTNTSASDGTTDQD